MTNTVGGRGGTIAKKSKEGGAKGLYIGHSLSKENGIVIPNVRNQVAHARVIERISSYDFSHDSCDEILHVLSERLP